MNSRVVKFHYGSDVRKAFLKDSCETFEKLEALVHELFRDRLLDGDTIRYRYVDADGDLVTIATDSDWRLAVSEMDNLRIFIHPTSCDVDISPCTAVRDAMRLSKVEAHNILNELSAMKDFLSLLIDRFTDNNTNIHKTTKGSSHLQLHGLRSNDVQEDFVQGLIPRNADNVTHPLKKADTEELCENTSPIPSPLLSSTEPVLSEGALKSTQPVLVALAQESITSSIVNEVEHLLKYESSDDSSEKMPESPTELAQATQVAGMNDAEKPSDDQRPLSDLVGGSDNLVASSGQHDGVSMSVWRTVQRDISHVEANVLHTSAQSPPVPTRSTQQVAETPAFQGGLPIIPSQDASGQLKPIQHTSSQNPDMSGQTGSTSPRLTIEHTSSRVSQTQTSQPLQSIGSVPPNPSLPGETVARVQKTPPTRPIYRSRSVNSPASLMHDVERMCRSAAQETFDHLPPPQYEVETFTDVKQSIDDPDRVPENEVAPACTRRMVEDFASRPSSSLKRDSPICYCELISNHQQLYGVNSLLPELKGKTSCQGRTVENTSDKQKVKVESPLCYCELLGNLAEFTGTSESDRNHSESLRTLTEDKIVCPGRKMERHEEDRIPKAQNEAPMCYCELLRKEEETTGVDPLSSELDRSDLPRVKTEKVSPHPGHMALLHEYGSEQWTEVPSTAGDVLQLDNLDCCQNQTDESETLKWHTLGKMSSHVFPRSMSPPPTGRFSYRPHSADIVPRYVKECVGVSLIRTFKPVCEIRRGQQASTYVVETGEQPSPSLIRQTDRGNFVVDNVLAPTCGRYMSAIPPQNFMHSVSRADEFASLSSATPDIRRFYSSLLPPLRGVNEPCVDSARQIRDRLSAPPQYFSFAITCDGGNSMSPTDRYRRPLTPQTTYWPPGHVEDLSHASNVTARVEYPRTPSPRPSPRVSFTASSLDAPFVGSHSSGGSQRQSMTRQLAQLRTSGYANSLGQPDLRDHTFQSMDPIYQRHSTPRHYGQSPESEHSEYQATLTLEMEQSSKCNHYIEPVRPYNAGGSPNRTQVPPQTIALRQSRSLPCSPLSSPVPQGAQPSYRYQICTDSFPRPGALECVFRPRSVIGECVPPDSNRPGLSIGPCQCGPRSMEARGGGFHDEGTIRICLPDSVLANRTREYSPEDNLFVSCESEYQSARFNPNEPSLRDNAWRNQPAQSTYRQDFGNPGYISNPPIGTRPTGRLGLPAYTPSFADRTSSRSMKAADSSSRKSSPQPSRRTPPTDRSTSQTPNRLAVPGRPDTTTETGRHSKDKLKASKQAAASHSRSQKVHSSTHVQTSSPVTTDNLTEAAIRALEELLGKDWLAKFKHFRSCECGPSEESPSRNGQHREGRHRTHRKSHSSRRGSLRKRSSTWETKSTRSDSSHQKRKRKRRTSGTSPRSSRRPSGSKFRQVSSPEDSHSSHEIQQDLQRYIPELRQISPSEDDYSEDNFAPEPLPASTSVKPEPVAPQDDYVRDRFAPKLSQDHVSSSRSKPRVHQAHTREETVVQEVVEPVSNTPIVDAATNLFRKAVKFEPSAGESMQTRDARSEEAPTTHSLHPIVDHKAEQRVSSLELGDDLPGELTSDKDGQGALVQTGEDRGKMMRAIKAKKLVPLSGEQVQHRPVQGPCQPGHVCCPCQPAQHSLSSATCSRTNRMCGGCVPTTTYIHITTSPMCCPAQRCSCGNKGAAHRSSVVISSSGTHTTEHNHMHNPGIHMETYTSQRPDGHDERDLGPTTSPPPHDGQTHKRAEWIRVHETIEATQHTRVRKNSAGRNEPSTEQRAIQRQQLAITSRSGRQSKEDVQSNNHACTGSASRIMAGKQ